MAGRDFNDNPRQTRIFRKGDMKYIILDIIMQKPVHGYDITSHLERRFQGLYSPSAGSIYPILQTLEREKFVTSAATEGKNVYTISSLGLAFLEEKK